MASRNKITVINIINTIIVQGLAFFSGPIFSGMLGTDNYGIFSVYMTWVSIAAIVFPLQSGSAIAQARTDFKNDEQNRYQSSVFTMGTIAYLFFSIATLLIVSSIRNYYSFSLPMVACGLAHGWGSYCVTFLSSKYIYEFEAVKNCVLSVCISIFSIVSSILLIPLFKNDERYWGRVLGEGGTYFIIGIVLAVILICGGKTFFSWKYWGYTLPITLPIIIHSLSGIVLNQSDRVMLQQMIGNTSAGIYSLAYTFSSVVHIVWMALNRSWVPFFYEYSRNCDLRSIKIHSKNYNQVFSIITSGFILLSKEVFHFYADIDFWSGENIIPLLAIGYYFLFLYSFPVNFELYHKKTKVVAIGTSIAAVANILMNYLFISLFDMLGAVIATVLSFALQFLFHWILGKRIDRDNFPFALSEFVPGFMMVGLSVVLYYICNDFWIIRWILGIVLGIYLAIQVYKRKELF